MMLEELYEDNLIGDPNDLEEIIEQHADDLHDEAEEAQENEGNDNDEAADAGDENTTDGQKVDPKKKRIVRNPQPKLNPERLKGPRGIAVIEDAFKDFKFHGKGYERVDLNRVMKRLEHWAHRLYPRFQFDDCLDKIEKLGLKKPVQVYVKKIRMGLETIEEPVVLNDEPEEDAYEIQNEAPIDAFDELLSQQIAQHSQGRVENHRHIPSTPTPSVPQQTDVPELTVEQRERMLRNRMIAEERRLARMKLRHEIQKAKAEEDAAELSSHHSSSKAPTLDNVATSSNIVYLETSNPSSNINKITSSTSEVTNSENVGVIELGNDISSLPNHEKHDTISLKLSVDGSESKIPSTEEPLHVNVNENSILSVEVSENKILNSPSVDAEVTNSMTIDVKESKSVNANSKTIDVEENNTNPMSIDSEENTVVGMFVDTRDGSSSGMAVDLEETSTSTDIKEKNASMSVDIQDKITCLPIEDSTQTAMSVDSNETNSTDMVIDLKEINANSMEIDGKDNNCAAMNPDLEETSTTTMLNDKETDPSATAVEIFDKDSKSAAMNFDVEETSVTTMLIDSKGTDPAATPIETEEID